MSGRGGKLLGGFIVLHVLCCGLPLLIAAGAFTGAGALLDSGALVAIGLLGVLAAVGLAVRRSRGARDADCCAVPDAVSDADADAGALSGQR